MNSRISGNFGITQGDPPTASMVPEGLSSTASNDASFTQTTPESEAKGGTRGMDEQTKADCAAFARFRRALLPELPVPAAIRVDTILVPTVDVHRSTTNWPNKNIGCSGRLKDMSRSVANHITSTKCLLVRIRTMPPSQMPSRDSGSRGNDRRTTRSSSSASTRASRSCTGRTFKAFLKSASHPVD